MRDKKEYIKAGEEGHKVTRGIKTCRATDEAGAIISARCRPTYAITMRAYLAMLQAIDPRWTLSLMIRRAVVIGVKKMLLDQERVAAKWLAKGKR
jgi:hypothetical protein